MTKAEFYKKMEPLFSDYFSEMGKDGEMAVSNAFDIACMKEFEYRLAGNGCDDEEDDDLFLDEVDPEWFFGFLLNYPDEDENIGYIFVHTYGEAYAHWKAILADAQANWQRHMEGKA